MGRGKHLWVEGEASLTPTLFKERFANQYQGAWDQVKTRVHCDAKS